MRAEVPLHPSYEDRPGAPDRVFAALDDDAFEHHVHAWARALAGAGAADADVLHLHHLTPINEAAARVAPGVPVVGHLHGTELLMLEAIEDDPGRWAHGAGLGGAAARVGGALRAADRALGQPGRARRAPARRRRGALRARRQRLRPGRLPPRHVDHRALWRRGAGRGAARLGAGRGGGLVRYEEGDLAAFGDDRGETPVLLYVGRYTEVKRLSLLIEAYARGRAALRPPRAAGARRRLPGRVGGRAPARGDPPHRRPRRLPGRLARPCRAARPPRRLRHRRAAVGARAVRPGARGGRRVRAAVDRRRRARAGRDRPRRRDRAARAARRPEALAAALVEAVNDPQERRRRGVLAAEDARARYAWPALAERVADVYEAARTA